MIGSSGVYQILNQINGKRYIGSSIDIRGRAKCLEYPNKQQHDA